MVSRSDWRFSNNALCGWKHQFRNDSPFRTVCRCGQLLVYLPDFGPSSFVSFSQPVRQVSLQTQRGLAALPARFPIRLCQCPRPLNPFCRHLYSVIGACQWGAFLEPILHKEILWDPAVIYSHNMAESAQTSLFQ